LKHKNLSICLNTGMTLVEMLVSMTVILIVFAMVASVFMQTRKISARDQMDVEIIQNARIGLNEIARLLRMTGYQRDRENGQVALLEAAPFQVIFNANLDEEEPSSQQRAALPADSVIPLYDGPPEYTVPMEYTTGAETVWVTLDSSRDGLVAQDDINDNVGERSTRFNPNDMELIKRINFDRAQPIVSGVIGPYDAEGLPTNIPPMFQYWRVNADKSFSLLGDEDGNGKLEGDERYFRAIVSQDVLRYIRRIEITITTQSDHRDPFQPSPYRQVSVSTMVSLRNL